MICLTGYIEITSTILLPIGIVVPPTATLPIISGNSKLVEIIRWKNEQIQNLLFDFHNVPGDLMRCINALWFLCYNKYVLLILWLQNVFVIQELGLEMCFRINLPFSDLTWWHYNYLPAYMLNVSILWCRSFNCSVKATRSCFIYICPRCFVFER